MLATLNALFSSAEICRRNNWAPGTVLISDAREKDVCRAPKRIELTAIGLRCVLAIDLDEQQAECIWCLIMRDWRQEAS